MAPRFSFRYKNVKYDIALLTETESINTFAFKVQKPFWTEVATNLKNSDLKMPVTECNCRERVTQLLKEFNSDENLSRKASGVSEDEMSELKLLLTRVKQLASEGKGVAKNMYNKTDRDEAEKMREEALIEIEDLESDEDRSCSPKTFEEREDEDATPPKKMKRFKRGDGISYLEKKHQTDSDLKREELSIRKLEVENKFLELNIMKEKQEQEYKIKLAELEIKKNSQESQDAEKAALTNALMQVLSKVQRE